MVAGTRGRTQIKRRLCAGGILAALAAIVLAAPTSAGPRRAGDLDPSFGDHGLRVVRKVNDAARAVAIGRKNRIVVAGSKTVVRLRPSGRLDRSFADGGIARLEFVQGKLHTFYVTSSSSLALSPRGGIFVVGNECSGDTGCAFAVTHLKRDGDLDRSFGEDGIARVDFANPETYSSSIAIARGGRLIVAGRTCTYPPYDCNLALARLDRHGHLDRSFGDRGEVIVPVGRGGDCRHSEDNPMALDSRGRIVMAADCAFHQLSVARFRPSGHLDRSFARRGEVNRRVRLEWVGALAIDSHDRIDVAGPAPRDSYGVVRFQRKGRLDSAFGNHGTATVRLREKRIEYAAPDSAVIDSRGRIVLAGHGSGFSFARFKRGGQADRRFGRRGEMVTGLARVGLGAAAAAIDRRDRIVGAGAAMKPHEESHFALVRLIG